MSLRWYPGITEKSTFQVPLKGFNISKNVIHCTCLCMFVLTEREPQNFCLGAACRVGYSWVNIRKSFSPFVPLIFFIGIFNGFFPCGRGKRRMTTFVPLAADTDGTATAVAVGDWLLHSEI